VSGLAAESRADALEAADLRFGQVGIASVRVRSDDPGALQAALEVRVREAPQLFARAPVVVDLSFLSPHPSDESVNTLLAAIRAAGMLPVGLAYGDSETDELSLRLGLPLIAKFRAAYERAEHVAPVQDESGSAPESTSAAPVTASAPAPTTALQQHGSVRTGQQVYARGSDLVVVGAVANGAEALADGNIHVYGALRGRAFAGALGDKSTRIFCSEFRAEIVSIAGHYRVFEELPGEWAGRAVQIWLDQDKLRIAAF
jgi:septum site-determining protein MinC